MLVTILSIAIIAIFFYYLKKRSRYWTDRGVKQTEPIPLFGDTWGQVFRVNSFTQILQNVYNHCPGSRYTGFYQFTIPVLLVKDPELIKEMMIKNFEHFPERMELVPENTDPLWAKNLFALKGQKWRDMRTTLSPSFTSSKMKMMFVLIQECAQNFVQHFLDKDQEIVTVQVRDIFSRFANDVIATSAFGIRVDSLGEPNNKFYLMGKEATNFESLWNNIKFFGYNIMPKLYEVFKVRLFTNEVSQFFRQIIDDTLKMREEKGIVRPDMINLLMEARKGTKIEEEDGIIDTMFAAEKETNDTVGKFRRDLTNEDITAQALIFFFAGFDTVSSLMMFTAYELAVNQDVQQKLWEEVEATTHECKGKLTYEALLKMKYLDMVISEALRKWPNQTVADRVCHKPFVIQPVTPEENAVHIEKGTLAWIPVFSIHHNPEYYPDPERFDPERFNSENKRNIKPYTYLPFGVGPRICIGSRFALMEMKTLFFNILSHFEIVPVEKTKIPVELSKKTFSLTPEGGVWLGLKRRK